METYALVRDGIVVNICLWDGATPYDPGADQIILLSELPPGIGIGWSNESGEWRAPDVAGLPMDQP